MKKLSIITILLTIWAGVFSQGTINQVNTEFDASKGTYHPTDFEEFIIDWSDGLVPGLSICVLKNGELYWVFHHGYANLAQEKLVNDSSAFYLASISKTICQTASMQLWEQDEFELHDCVGDYAEFPIINPNCPDSCITFFHLMTHTSSINDNYWGNPSFNQFIPGYFTPGGLYYYASNFYNYCPGEYWNYSNVGNSLLGYLTQEISGQDYSAYCEEHVFQPLGVTEGSYYLANINPDNLVTQYTSSGPGSFTQHGTPDGGGPIYPAGVLKMSAIQLSKFLGMYMKGGTYNGNILLDPETIELITTPTGIMTDMDEQCLTWRHFPSTDNTYHSGGSNFASTVMGYDKDDQCGNIMLMNVGIWDEAFTPYLQLAYFANLYDAISITNLEINDANGNLVIEANETFELGLTLRNDMNYPSSTAENIMATVSVSSPFVNLISDSVIAVGPLNYLEEIQLSSDQFEFEVTENLEPGNVEFQIHFTWDDGVGYTTSFNLFVGHADVLLVRDEDNISICLETGVKKIQEAYLESLDTLGFLTNYWDLQERGDPTVEFIQNFPAVIWFTGADEENTLSENNQTILEGYLDNGGQLFLSGQDISDELAGSNFLENYLFTEHIQDTWYGNKTIKGIENDPIGNGQIYQLNQGDGIANQTSVSVVEPLPGAFKSFGYYYSSMDGAAVRYENDTYKTIFFAFGFEAINEFNNRTDILDRILNDYFIIPHPCLPEGITFSTQQEIDNFQSNYPNCSEIEGSVTISGNDITNLEGLNVLTSIGGGLMVSNNTLLTNLSGLDNLSFIGASITINSNDALTNLAGLENLSYLEAGLIIGDYENGNPLLTSLSGLNNITAIAGALVIKDNYSLTDLSGLDNLSNIIYDLSIEENFSLTSMTGLSNLSSIGGYLNISENGNLINLDSLINLNSIDGELIIKNNAFLTSLTGLDSINPGSISDLTIKNNPLLSTCHVTSICDYLAAPNGTIEIENNAPDCNSQTEVELACWNSVNEINSEEQFILSPNPCSAYANLQFVIRKSGLVNCELFDVSGVKMKTLVNEIKNPGVYEMEIDLSDIPVGIYFCVLKTNEETQTKKLIKLN